MTHTAADVERSRARFRVTHELSEAELHHAISDPCIDVQFATTALTISISAPTALFDELHGTLNPMGSRVIDGEATGANLHVMALPWHGKELFETPEFEEGQTPLLPLRFDEFSVTVGPLLDTGGPCPTCALPAILHGVAQPAPTMQAALFAAATSACAWYIRAFDAHAQSVTSLSMTIDSRTPRVEHRL